MPSQIEAQWPSCMQMFDFIEPPNWYIPNLNLVECSISDALQQPRGQDINHLKSAEQLLGHVQLACLLLNGVLLTMV